MKATWSTRRTAVVVSLGWLVLLYGLGALAFSRPAIGLLLKLPYSVPQMLALSVARNPQCSLGDAIDGGWNALLHESIVLSIQKHCWVVESDGAGYRLWETPSGRFWMPAGAPDTLLPHLLAEQREHVYGDGSRAVQPGDIVLDCGANVGVVTRNALNAGARVVVAIEPAPENLECLRRNFSREIAAGRVIVYPKGVWDKDDFLRMNVRLSNPAADTFVTPVGSDCLTAKLPLTTIDQLVSELRLPRVDYIKMDIEGAEQRALAGAQKTLAAFHPRLSVSVYHLPGDRERIPQLIRQAFPGYRNACTACGIRGRIEADVMHFWPAQ